jgi:hypothetical protein
MDMAKRNIKANGTMIADCPCCKDWQGETRGRVSLCRFTDGTTHAAPEMWIASRSTRIEQANPRLSAMEAWAAAWSDWATNCEMQARFAERQAVA